jgi:hypothetical protein
LDVINKLVACWFVSSSFPELDQHSFNCCWYLFPMSVDIVHCPTHQAGINIDEVVRSRDRFLFCFGVLFEVARGSVIG